MQDPTGTGDARNDSHEDDLYSPTTPLQINFSSSESEEAEDIRVIDAPQNHQIVLGLPCNSSVFTGKRRRDGVLHRSRSAESFFMFAGTALQVRQKKGKRDMKSGTRRVVSI